jgi:uncharacterized protein
MSAQTTTIRTAVVAFFAGLIFAAGLTLGGMMDPRKVQGFLDVGALFGWGGGQWDPSLAFVMGGALLVSLFAFGAVRSDHTPWAATRFEPPKRRDIDVKLIAGAALFGAGWGIAGYCPGPALASLFTGGTDILWFLGAMLPGMLVAKQWFP